MRGVYLVFRTNPTAPRFLSNSTCGSFNGRDPTVSLPELMTNWVNNAKVVYIGKAGGSGSNATLQGRLGQYMEIGLGKKVGHWGSRYIWQLADYRDLLVAWLPTPNEEPEEVETDLIEAFRREYGQRPFANLNE